MLREYGIDFTSPDLFTGQFLNDTNYANLSDWRMLYETLYSMQMTDTAHLVGLDTVNDTLNNYISFGIPISFAMLYYNYQSFDSSAVANHLIYISNRQLFDTPDSTRSPYKTHSAFCVAPILQTVFTGTNQFAFRSTLIFSNAGKTISTIQIDPTGSGTYQTVTLNTPFNVTYSTSGVYPITVKVTYSDGTINWAHSKVVVYNQIGGSGYAINNAHSHQAEGFGPPNDRDFRNYEQYASDEIGPVTFTARKAYMGTYGTADYTISPSKYHSGKLLKPLIVVDGFDPFGGNTLDQYYLPDINADENYTSYVPVPLNGYSFTADTGFDNHDSLDIVYLHWSNSTDYIERNAYVLETLIQIVDSIKAANGSSEKNIVLGTSMGGLVARYALKDMENNSIPHQTWLFISHDAPYWGANVPVSLQLMVQHIGSWKEIHIGTRPLTISYADLFPQISFATALYSSPAAKEMLIQRYNLNQSGTPGVTPVTYSISADNSTYTNFQTELNTLGWPSTCRNVTLSNGACNGTKQFTSNSAQFIGLGGDTSLNGIFGFTANFLVSSILGDEAGLIEGDLDNFSIPINPAALLWQFIEAPYTTRSTININFDAYSIPQTGTGSIYYGNLSVYRQLFFGLFAVNNNLINCQISSTSAMLPLDNAPGGAYPLVQWSLNIDSINNALQNGVFAFMTASSPQQIFCFVPTVSSLALTNASTYLDSSICSNVNCLNSSSVYDYYAPSVNQFHVTYTVPSSFWLLNEDQPSYSCQKVCPTGLAVSGDSVFCTISHQYSISGIPSNTSLTWTATPSSIVHIYNPNDDTTTLSRDTLSDAIDLQANIGNVCGTNPTIVVSKNVKVGAPKYYSGTSLFTTSGVNNEILQSCNDLTELSNQFWTGYVSTFDSVATSYSWSLVAESSGADAILVNDPNAQYVEVEIKPGDAWAQYQLTISNACGTYDPLYTFNANESCNIMIRENQTDFSLTPNPASNSVTISTVPAQSTSLAASDAANTSVPTNTAKSINQLATVQRIIVYSVDGKQVLDVTLNSPQNTANISTAGLPRGVYFVHIIDSNKMVKIKKLVIER
jgi:hypothetical protein